MPPFRAVSRAFALSIVLLAGKGYAQTAALRLETALRSLPDEGVRVLSDWSGTSAPPLLLRMTSDAAARQRGFIPIGGGIAVGHLPRTQWSDLWEASDVERAFVPSGRFLLLDRAGDTVGRRSTHEDAGLRGEGTIIGVVDTGGDVFHPALRGEDGSTRVAWFLAFDREPLGLHPELEEEYGCLGGDPCAIFGREDIDAALASGERGQLPDDPIGHATHITSLAAGRDDAYPGIAPLADLILVSAAGPDGRVNDARILLGTKFTFDRAREAALPAVVNVSLGSSVGAHDGTATVELGLAELASGEGRAIVLAAGNSGAVYEGVSRDYPSPFGVHTEVAVLPSSTVRVPILTPDHPSGTHTGGVLVWVSTRPGDDLRVGFSNGQGEESRLVSKGEAGALHSSSLDDPGDYDVVFVNGKVQDLYPDVLPTSAIVHIAGTWNAGRVFELVLEGHANARMWVSGTGTLSPLVSQFGPLFPRARRAGTVAVPGSHPDLITVGATVNRSEWEDYTGELVGFGNHGEGRADFSAAGPSQTRTMKPELVAPGMGLIGAMAQSSDPRTSLRPSQFSSHGSCPDEVECFVIDDEHGLASGTSMAAPLVTGAVALLLQRDPSLTMAQLKRYLMAGTHEVAGQTSPSLVGTGELDLVGALIAQERDLDDSSPGAPPSAPHSRVVWADSFLYPGTGPALSGYLLVRDEAGRPVDVDDADLTISTTGPGRTNKERLAPGLVLLEVTADEDATSESVTVRCSIGGETVSERTFAVERDPILAKYGYELSGGTCSSSARTSRPWSLPVLMALFGVTVGWRARRRSRGDSREPRGVRGPDRMDA